MLRLDSRSILAPVGLGLLLVLLLNLTGQLTFTLLFSSYLKVVVDANNLDLKLSPRYKVSLLTC